MPEIPAKVLFDELFVTNRDKIYRFAFKLTNDAARAEEVTQQCFIRLWENIDKVQPGQDIFPLLFVYVKNIIIDETRRLYREKKNLGELTLHKKEVREEGSAENTLLYKELRKEMQQLIARLPEQRRNIYLLSRDQGHTHKEIAAQLSLSPMTVRNHLQLAAQFIRRELMARYDMEKITL
ncbi:RNA polymerase sigma-70 factor [Chitinophaga niabensis]|uniref:RNA polymerase sigma-70 factor n=1 Tax=Chitinophaga niabensis TaxID=536979 RepID=UPI0031BA6D61